MKTALLTLIVGVMHQSIAFAEDPQSFLWQRLIDSSEIIAEARSIRTEMVPGRALPTWRTYFQIKEVFKGTNLQEMAVDWDPTPNIYNVTLGDVGAEYMLFLRPELLLRRESTNAVSVRRTDRWVLRQHCFMRQTNVNGQQVVDQRSLMLVLDVPPEINLNLSTGTQPLIEWKSLVKWLRRNVKSKHHPDQFGSSAFVLPAICFCTVVLACLLAVLVRRRKSATNG